jgi:hypothetical protein
MAKRGSAKDLSVRQEDYIAGLFRGERSKSSGAAEYDAGDVRCQYLLIECKVKMPDHSAVVTKPMPMFVRQLEKIAAEAWETGKDPMLSLRYYFPNSPLANADGWVDVIVMRATDAADREHVYETARQEAA